MNLEKKDYNYGVDILKILATAMIIIMHILLQGGVIRGTVPGTANYYLSWILEGICFGGVNLYALGTGFLNAKKNIKISSFIKRWFQVFFYVAFFTLLFRLLMPGVVSLKSWVEVFVPILSNQYWYFTQYFVLFLLMPFLNKLMASLNEREFKKLVCVIILVFSFIPTIRQYDIFYTANGYSALWLMAMYLIGGYFAYYKDNVKISKKTLWMIILASNVIGIGSKFLFDTATHVALVNDVQNMVLLSYTSITIIINSIAVLLLCINLQVSKFKKSLRLVGSITFGIYLVHVNAFIWNYLLRDLFMFMSSWNSILLVLGILGSFLAIFVVAGLFEYLRIKFFKLIKIDTFSNWLGLKLSNLSNYILKKL